MSGEWLEYRPEEKADHLRRIALEMFTDEARDKERLERENELLREELRSRHDDLEDAA